MPTLDDVRRIALSMPEAYASSHFDVSDFRVNKKIFATLHPTEVRMVVKLDPEDQQNLVDGEAIQRIPNAWGAKGWTYVYVERLEAGRLEGLIRLAWATVAPKRLLKAPPPS